MLKLIEIDSAVLYDSIIQAVELATKEPMYPGDERRIFAEAIVQVAVAITTSAIPPATIRCSNTRRVTRWTRWAIEHALNGFRRKPHPQLSSLRWRRRGLRIRPSPWER